MKRFIKDIVLVVCLLFTLLLICEIFIFPYASKNIYNYKFNYAKTNANKIAILLMGNSYFENSINPYYLGDSVFDMAVEARWIYYDKELLNYFVPKMNKLKTVIFPMGYKIPFFYSHHFYNSDIEIINKSMDYVHEKFMHVWYDRTPEKYFRYLYILNGVTSGNRLFSNNVYCDSLGYTCLTGHCNDNWKNEQNINVNVINNKYAREQVAEYTNYLKDMAKICQMYNVRFIVVTPPCHDSFNENVRQTGLDILYGIIEEVSAEYPIEYMDYLLDKEFRADSIYHDCSHLNSIGANLFALRIKKDFGL